MKKGILKISLFLIIIIILLFSLNFLKISPFNAELSGKELAEKHCQSCHLLPNPEQLSKETWPFVLDWMGNYLGYLTSTPEINSLVNQRQIPEFKTVSEEELRKIRNYFIENSPSQNKILSQIKNDNAVLNQFNPLLINNKVNINEIITSIYYSHKKELFFIGYGKSRKLEIFDSKWKKIKEITFNSEPIQIAESPIGFKVTLIGDLARDNKNGQVIELNEKDYEPKLIIYNYHRLTQTLYDDFNNDGINELLLVGYGDYDVGQVSLRYFDRNKENHKETILFNEAGALCAEVYDFDNNGFKDILLLTAQGKNRLILYINNGKGEFTQKIIHQKHSSFGYNHFSIADFNKDGKMDLITVNGNNMEIPNPPIRPYHGIRILINQGNLTFKETYFYPFPGALKAIAYDFDKDGDLDISAISFFPNWSSQFPKTFAYLENKGNNKFYSHFIPQEYWGRWLTMELGDLNKDGKEDIILGACNTFSGINSSLIDVHKNKIIEAPTFLILQNKGID